MNINFVIKTKHDTIIQMSNPLTKEAIAAVGTYILDGMSEKEACILAEISYTDLQDLKDREEVIRNFIEKKHTQFKHNNLKTIQSKKSEKNSQWLLEKLRPDEFGTKARPADTNNINILGLIIKDIQNNGNAIVRHTRGNIIEHESDQDTPKARVAQIS